MISLILYIFISRSGLSKRQTQLLYSYILMWVIPETAKEDDLVKGNSVQKSLPNQLVGRYIIYFLLNCIDKYKFSSYSSITFTGL